MEEAPGRIVERLRARELIARRVRNEFFNGERPLDEDPLDEMCAEAADTLAALTAERDALREKVRRLQDVVQQYGDRSAMSRAPAGLQEEIDEAMILRNSAPYSAALDATKEKNPNG